MCLAGGVSFAIVPCRSIALPRLTSFDYLIINTADSLQDCRACNYARKKRSTKSSLRKSQRHSPAATYNAIRIHISTQRNEPARALAVVYVESCMNSNDVVDSHVTASTAGLPLSLSFLYTTSQTQILVAVAERSRIVAGLRDKKNTNYVYLAYPSSPTCPTLSRRFLRGNQPVLSNVPLLQIQTNQLPSPRKMDIWYDRTTRSSMRAPSILAARTVADFTEVHRTERSAYQPRVVVRFRLDCSGRRALPLPSSPLRPIRRRKRAFAR